jgi:hypothetical protein
LKLLIINENRAGGVAQGKCEAEVETPVLPKKKK